MDDGQLREASVLQFLKVGSAGWIKRNDFTIEHSFFEVQPLESFGMRYLAV